MLRGGLSARSIFRHILLGFLVWGRRTCLVCGASAMTEDFLQTRIQATCDNIHKYLVCLNDRDSQPSYRHETSDIVTYHTSKGKRNQERPLKRLMNV